MIRNLIFEINSEITEPITIMEVCGTHTHEIAKSGIHNILSPLIRIQSGPGCPVCVTSEVFIDRAIEIAKQGAIIVTFGDMLSVKGSRSSLLDLKTEGYDIRVVYSPNEILNIALKNINKDIVFVGVGFETTSPIIARVIKEVDSLGLKNIYFLLSLKRMEPILRKVLEDKNQKIDGLICPGHVASIVGADYFKFIADEYNVTCVICGFEPVDLIGGIYYLVKNYSKGKFLNLYKRVVTKDGNLKALKLLDDVFEIDDEAWRGLGKVKNSGFILKERYKKYDAIDKFNIESIEASNQTNCICKDIIMGYKSPIDCPLFNKACNPKNPKGPCMTSSEGACLAYYKYRREL